MMTMMISCFILCYEAHKPLYCCVIVIYKHVVIIDLLLAGVKQGTFHSPCLPDRYNGTWRHGGHEHILRLAASAFLFYNVVHETSHGCTLFNSSIFDVHYVNHCFNIFTVVKINLWVSMWVIIFSPD